MFESTLVAELARRQGQIVIINTFNYEQTGILAVVEADYVVLVETVGYGVSDTEIISVDAIQSAFFPA
ncbi:MULTISPECIES: hypothetical protein [Priestia]|uniref:hypothetical protein n=1 Tax=Priestia TaxID=2800373 RepID=UPI0011B3B313|nr:MULTISPECIES: hypothetical protein [Priestia]MCG0050099.1 hypothetical protein [Priestia aryabhattai]QDZ88129.1 hypothetical protein D0441_27990 [Priestia megaterium]